MISEMFICEVLKTYPTGFFLEDQYIRSLVDYRLTLDASFVKSIHLAPNSLDEGFPLYIHPKYWTIEDVLGPLEGFYNAYVFRRDKIIEDFNSYYLRQEKIETPIVPLANATYEIINNHFYGDLEELANYYNPSYCFGLELWLSEIILQVGSLGRRPKSFPIPRDFPAHEERVVINPYLYQGWVLLSLKEQEIYGNRLEKKQKCESLLVLNLKMKSSEDLYSKYLFKLDQYFNESTDNVQLDNPINALTINDTLEHCEIVFVNPSIVRQLGLCIDRCLHDGLKARNGQGEIVLKMIRWKEEYIGSISSGAEVPLLDGVAVLIRKDYFDKLLMIYDDELNYILYKHET